MNIGDFFNSIFLYPLINALIFIYKLLEMVNIPGALGFSIIILSIAIRFIIWPLSAAQLKSSQQMNKIKPLLDELKSKHKNDKMALQKAQMELYKQHNINPASGCLPALIQIPIFIALYQSISQMFPGASNQNLGWINSILYNPWLHLDMVPDSLFLGFNLSLKPADFSKVGLLAVLVPLITAVLSFVQSKMMLPKKALKTYPTDSKKEKKEKESFEDSMASIQGQMVYLMPIMIGYFAFQFPIGLALYWNTFTILGIIQQYKISGWGGFEDMAKKIRLVK